MIKRNVKYQGISIPVPIINQIKGHINKHQEYTSVTNFIRIAIRDKIDSDLHPWYNQNPPPNLTEKEKEADAFFRKYTNEDFKKGFEKRTSDIFYKLMKKQIRKDEKEKRKKKKK